MDNQEIIRIIADAGEIAQYELQKKVNMRKSTLSMRLRKLKDEGALHTWKVRSGKANITMLSVTGKGSPRPVEGQASQCRSGGQRFEVQFRVQNFQADSEVQGVEVQSVIHPVRQNFEVQKCEGPTEGHKVDIPSEVRAIIFSKGKGKILRYLAVKGEATENKIKTEAKVGGGRVKQYIGSFIKLHFVTARWDGKNTFYSLNSSNRYLPCIFKTLSLLERRVWLEETFWDLIEAHFGGADPK